MKMKEQGAVMSSNSWGSPYYHYIITSLLIDIFAYNNPEFVILFSQGNTGEEGYNL